jgi:hypothetical protein
MFRRKQRARAAETKNERGDVTQDKIETDATENPWQTLSTKEVYDNSWISVREDKVVRPDGAEGI